MVSITILVLVVSFSYAYIKLEKQEKETNLLGTDCIKLEMEEVTDALTLNKAYPMTDDNGEKTEPFTFKLRNDCGVGIDYQINLRVETTDNQMEAENNIATKIDEYDKVVLSTDNKLDKEGQIEYKISEKALNISPYGEVEHNVRIWLDENAGNDTQNKSFKSRIVIEATQNQIVEKYYKEAILHGADPVLNNTEEEPLAMLTASGEETADTLVPVIIGDDGKVTKADITQEWYDYETKRWANAVILVDNTKANEIQPGQEIKEEEIESYFVWIPKYRYKLFNLNKYDSVQTDTVEDKGPTTAIEIEFGTEDTKDEIDGECTTPNESGSDGSCQEGEWMTHPAFTAFPGSKGMWVGKFETGYKSANLYADFYDNNACLDKVNKIDINEIIIKPNVYSWRCISVVNMYQNSINYQRKLDSHMMKNTEWGAVAYLTQSIYGNCDNETGTCKEVRNNNLNNYLTGWAAKNVPDAIYPFLDYGSVSKGQENAEENGNFKGAYNYKRKEGNLASTTGNYTGIYDMSGGAWEYVMGYSDGHLEEIEFLEEATKYAKYFDVYKITTENEYNKRILGDATGELGPFLRVDLLDDADPNQGWYKDWATIPSSGDIFVRGGGVNSGMSAGVFAFFWGVEGVKYYRTFRIVLTPTNEAK